MAINYTWTFPTLHVKLAEDGLTNVVYSVDWIYTADDGVGLVASAYGSVAVPPPAPGQFTLYDQLTEQQVQGWVVEALGQAQVDIMTVNLAAQIDHQINPVDANLPPPWSN